MREPSKAKRNSLLAFVVPMVFAGCSYDASKLLVNADRDSSAAGGSDVNKFDALSAGGAGGSVGGSTGTPGASGPSCVGLAATCGPSNNESCCASLVVPGGAFYRSYDGVDFADKSHPATVSNFALDKYEITVGRFRAFVNAGMGTQSSAPAARAGEHPLIVGSGWNAKWNTNLPADTASLQSALKCDTTYQTWTDAPGESESRPMNCLDWYSAFAFCAWDGGRLATEAEWNYAASGGSEQRHYPWSSPPVSTTIDDTYAVYCGGSCTTTQNVGSKSPIGDGKWGHVDLAGNVWEWTFDSYVSPMSSAACTDCANLSVAPFRTCRGGSFNRNSAVLRSAVRFGDNPVSRLYYLGSRCARAVSQ